MITPDNYLDIQDDDYISGKDIIIKPPWGGEIAEAPGTRWCKDCQHFHNILYICESYTAELKNEIEIDRRKFGYFGFKVMTIIEESIAPEDFHNPINDRAPDPLVLGENLVIGHIFITECDDD